MCLLCEQSFEHGLLIDFVPDDIRTRHQMLSSQQQLHFSTRKQHIWSSTRLVLESEISCKAKQVIVIFYFSQFVYSDMSVASEIYLSKSNNSTNSSLLAAVN